MKSFLKRIKAELKLIQGYYYVFRLSLSIWRGTGFLRFMSYSTFRRMALPGALKKCGLKIKSKRGVC